jgi:hypothetical protein
MNPAFIGVLVLLLIVAGVTIGFLLMKPRNVQATASRTPTPVAEPAPVAEPTPATKVGSGKGVSASGSGSGKGMSASGSGSGKPKPKNVSTKKARLLLTTKYAKGGCEGKVVSNLTMNPGAKLGVEIKRSLPKGQYACCAQIENMKIDKLDAYQGKQGHLRMNDVDIQNKTVIDLTRNVEIPGGTQTVCTDKFEGTFRISQ